MQQNHCLQVFSEILATMPKGYSAHRFTPQHNGIFNCSSNGKYYEIEELQFDEEQPVLGNKTLFLVTAEDGTKGFILTTNKTNMAD